MRKYFLGLIIAIVLVAGAVTVYIAVKPEPTSATGGQICSIYDPTLRKWWCPDGTACGQIYGHCDAY